MSKETYNPHPAFSFFKSLQYKTSSAKLFLLNSVYFFLQTYWCLPHMALLTTFGPSLRTGLLNLPRSSSLWFNWSVSWYAHSPPPPDLTLNKKWSFPKLGLKGMQVTEVLLPHCCVTASSLAWNVKENVIHLSQYFSYSRIIMKIKGGMASYMEPWQGADYNNGWKEPHLSHSVPK